MSMVKIESTEGKNKRKKNSRPFHLIQHERDFAHKLKCFDAIERNGNDSTNLITYMISYQPKLKNKVIKFLSNVRDLSNLKVKMV